MATQWAYAMSAATTNRAFANQLWAVLWASAGESIRGDNSDTFNNRNAMEDSTHPGQAPFWYVIHTRLLQSQFDEMTAFLGGSNPQRWIDAGMTAGQLNAFRDDLDAVIGDWQTIDAGHAQFVADRNLVPAEV